MIDGSPSFCFFSKTSEDHLKNKIRIKSSKVVKRAKTGWNLCIYSLGALAGNSKQNANIFVVQRMV